MNRDEMWQIFDGEDDEPRCYCVSKKDAYSVCAVLECRWPDVFVKPPVNSSANDDKDRMDRDRQNG